MKIKKLTALAMTTALCATALFGCGSDKKDGDSDKKDEVKKVSIEVWGPAEDQDAEKGSWLQTECDEFNKAHPEWDITFTYNTCSEADAKGSVTTDPTAAAAIYMYANDQIPDLLNANALAPISGNYLKEIESICDAETLKSVTFDGKVYGAPYTSNTWYMYYDKSVYSDEDIKSIDAMIAKKAISFPVKNTWYIQSFFVGNGCTFYGGENDETKGIDFSADKSTPVAEYLAKLMATGKVVVDDNGAGLAGLKDGSVGAIFSGSWDAQNVRDILGDNTGVAALPTYDLNGEAKQMYSFLGTKAIGVNPQSKAYTECPEAVIALATYLASTEAQLARFELRGVIPSSTELASDETVTKDPVAVAQMETAAKTSILQPFNQSMSNNYWTNMESFCKPLGDGEFTTEGYNGKSIEENMKELDDAFNAR